MVVACSTVALDCMIQTVVSVTKPTLTDTSGVDKIVETPVSIIIAGIKEQLRLYLWC